MLKLSNFKKMAENSRKNNRISLEDFKKNISKEDEMMDIEKLTGGILGACHSGPCPPGSDFPCYNGWWY